MPATMRVAPQSLKSHRDDIDFHITSCYFQASFDVASGCLYFSPAAALPSFWAFIIIQLALMRSLTSILRALARRRTSLCAHAIAEPLLSWA